MSDGPHHTGNALNDSGTAHESTYVLAFESTHAALAAQKKLASFNPHIIPTPSNIAAGCGMSLKFSATDDEHAMGILCQADVGRGAALYLSGEDGYSYLPYAHASGGSCRYGSDGRN